MVGDLKKYGVLLALVLPVGASADDLPDPTRPPAAIMAPAAEGLGPVEEASTGLQSIIISSKRRAAIIDGETVELGGRHGDARLVEVNESSVVLKGPQGKEVLTLFPGVKIRNAAKEKPPVAVDKVKSGKARIRPVAPKEEK